MPTIARLEVEVGADVSEADRKLDTLDGTMRSKVAGGAKAVGGALIGITTAALTAGTAAAGFGLSAASSNEQAGVSFGVLLGSAEKAKAFMGELSTFAAKTPFELPGLRDSASKLLGAGLDVKSVIPILTQVGNATSAMGTGADGVNRASIALAQMASTGKVTGEDLAQLRDAGVPALQVLAQTMGVDVATAQDRVSKGLVDSQVLFKALESGAAPALQRLSGLMDQQSATLEGMVATLKDTVGGLLSTALGPAVQAIKEQLPAVTETISTALTAAGPGISALATGLASGVGSILTALGPAIGPLASALGSVLGTIGEVFGELAPEIGAFATALGPLIVSVGNLFVSLAGPLLGAVLDIATALAGALVPVIEALQPAFDAMGPVIRTLGTVLAGMAPVLGEVATMLANVFAQAIQALAPVLPVVADAIFQVFMSLTPLIPALGQVLVALVPLIPALLPLITLAAQLLTTLAPLIELLANLLADGLVALIPVITAVVGVVGKLANVLSVALSGPLNAIQEWLLAVSVDDFYNGLRLIGDWFADLPGVVGSALTSFASSVGDAFGSAWSTIADFAESIPGAIGRGLAALPRLIGRAFTAAVRTAVAAWFELYVEIPLSIIQAIPGVLSALGQLGVAAVEWFAGLHVRLVEGALGLGVSLSQGIWSGLQALPGLLAQVPDMVWDALSGLTVTVWQIWKQVNDTTWEWIKGIATTVWNGLKSLPQTLWNIGTSMYETMLAVGKNVVIGLWNGLASMGGWLTGAVWDWVKSVLPGPVKAALGIASPSKVAEGLGAFFAQGLALGIQGGRSDVTAAARGLANAAAGPLDGTLTTGIVAGARPAPTAYAPTGGGTPQLVLPDGSIVSMDQLGRDIQLLFIRKARRSGGQVLTAT